METYVIDTNLFFNMEAGLGLGAKTEVVIKNITSAAKKMKDNKGGRIVLPPRILDEMLSFFDDKNQPFLQEFKAEVQIKSPDLHSLQFPAGVFYQLIEDIRLRSYRGLTIAGEEVQKAGRTFIGKGEVNKKEFEMEIGLVVKTLRDRYRQATRFGFLDSVADLDLITLAKETEGYLVSSDEGVIKWGRLFGVKEMPVSAFGQKMASLLSPLPHHQE